MALGLTGKLAYLPFAVWFFFETLLSSVHNPLHGTPGTISGRIARVWLVKRFSKEGTHRVMIALHKIRGKLIQTGLKGSKRFKPGRHRDKLWCRYKVSEGEVYSVW